MKRIIFSLICASLVLSVVAEATRLDRSQLKQLSVVKTPLDNSEGKAGQNKPSSMRQVVESRALTSVDNNSTENRTAQQSKGGFTIGSRIAKIDAYDFDWDDEQGVVIVNDSSCALMGKYCSIRRDTISGGLYLSGFLDRFDIPIQFDSPNELKIKAGIVLDSKISERLYSTIYAMPLSWLDGTTDTCDYIHAVVDDDVITFTDDFAFMISSQVVGSTSTSWGLTPIYKNVTLYRPNGKHQYWKQIMRDQFDFIQPGADDGQPPCHTTHGGREPKPIRPRPGKTHINSSFKMAFPDKVNTNDDNKLCYLPHNVDSLHLNIGGDEVYMYQYNDTTLMVYNLYGKDYCWNYMFINPDQSLRFPKQAICEDNDGNILYNCSSYNSQSDSTLVWGNQGRLHFQDGNELSSISWNRTYMCSNGGLLEEGYAWSSVWMDSDSGESLLIPTPNNLTVFPEVNSATVVWDCVGDEGDVLYIPRWRPWTDTSGNPINVTLPVDTYEDELDGWAFLDYDGDGYGWDIAVNPNDNSDICLYSDSYFNGALTPNNWLIAPLHKLEGVCKFKTAHRSNYPEMMEVMIGMEDAIDGNIVNTDKFTTIATFETTGNDFEEQTIDLSAYNGAKGYVVFRHYGTTDQWTLYLDDIFIGDPNAEIIEKPEWDYGYTESNAVEIFGLTPETTYEVQVQAFNETSQSAWSDIVYFTTLAEENNVYILGEVGEQNWAPNAGVQMTYDEENNVYVATVTFNGRNDEDGELVNYFAFTKRLGYNADDWATCNANRFGSETDGDFWVTPELMGQELGLVFPYEMSYRIAKGEYKMTVDLENMTLVIEDLTPPAPNVYILGEVGEQNWASNAGIQMAYEDGVYTAIVTFDGRNEENGEEVNYFAFTKRLGANADDWDTCNANRFGSEADGDFWVTSELMGQEIGLIFPYEMSYRIAKGEYKMTVDLENMTLVVEKVLRGDANKDGEVNIKDVSTLIDVLLGIDEVDYNAFSPENADVNKDGGISIADVSALIDILLEQM